MAKKAKGNRIQVILECTEHKTSGMPGTSRYISTKNRKNTTERLELKKYRKRVLRLPSQADLKSILEYHTYVGTLKTDYMDDGQSFEQVNGGKVSISKKDGKVMVNCNSFIR